MENKREYVAIVKTSKQISPDDFDTRDSVMKLTDSTTIGEIRNWYLNVLNIKEKDKYKVVGVRISEL